MSIVEGRRYGISEVSELTDVPVHLLRQWESRFTQLKPKRDRANRRYYTAADIDIVRRIKYLVKHEGMTMPGVERQLTRELLGEGRPKTRKEILDLIDTIDEEVRTLLDMLGPE